VKRDVGESSMPDVIVTQFPFSGDDDSAVYADRSRAASFIVKRSEFDDFILEGSLKHKGEQLSVTPSTRSRRSTRMMNPHVVDKMYSSVNDVDSSVDVRFVVTQLYVLETTMNSFTETLNTAAGGDPIDGATFIDEFAKWIPTQQMLTQTADMYMIFTGFDVAGVAPLGAVCNGTYSVTIVENFFMASVANVAAHELGHALNAEHDGEGSGSSCSEDLKNIMAPVFQADSNFAQPQNLFDFSSCSVESMADFLDTVTCTLPAQTTADVELTPVPDGDLVTDLDEQCRFLTQYSQGGRCS
ncbi:hypothetical protein BaRGS_00027868, partial [Batillaria attramentaria]